MAGNKANKENKEEKAEQAEVINITDIAELVKNPDVENNGKGKPETVLIMRGKIDDRQHAKLKHIDTKIAEHQIEIAVLQDYRNYIVNDELSKLGLDSTGQTKYILQTDGNIVESKEVNY